jgi:hypothetical protein
VIPAIKYATSGDLQIAYQVLGDGPVDVVVAFDWAGNIELMWENPQTERFWRRFASYGRLIFFDTRGIGLSDPVEDLPPLEEWMDDAWPVPPATVPACPRVRSRHGSKRSERPGERPTRCICG